MTNRTAAGQREGWPNVKIGAIRKMVLTPLLPREEMEKGARSGIEVEDYRKIDSFIEAKVLEVQMKKMKKVCECGEERDLKLNGLRDRQVKTLNNDLALKVPKVYCHRCNKYSQMGKGLLPEGSNIRQDLERIVLELVPLTTSHESLSELLWKLRGIKDKCQGDRADSHRERQTDKGYTDKRI